MENLLEAGIRFIQFLQGLGDWLTGPMQLFSFLGTEQFFLLVMPALYWCLDAGIGLRIGLMLLVSNGLNAVFKLLFQGPRPYFYSPSVEALSSETSFGAPSGHAQNAAAVWGLLSALAGRRRQDLRSAIWVGILLLIFLIGLSRLYLAVHFPQDVLLGWLIGGLLVWGFLKLEKPFAARIERQGLGSRLVIAFGASLLLLLLGSVARLSLGAWTVPSVWLANIAQAGSDLAAPEPLALSGIVSNAGALFGLAAGAAWLGTQGGFSAGGSLLQRLLRFPIGIAGVLVFWYLLGEALPRGELLIPYGLRYLRYALTGFWMSGLAPLLFMRLRLAGRPVDQAPALQVR
jgi:membrane-associated phospholipid phosphatase